MLSGSFSPLLKTPFHQSLMIYLQQVVKDNVNPGFGTEFIFYRRFPNEPITVQVWNYNLIKDSYMGKALFPCPVTNDKKVYTADLQGRWREKGMAKPGKVTIEATSVNDLFFL